MKKLRINFPFTRRIFVVIVFAIVCAWQKTFGAEDTDSTVITSKKPLINYNLSLTTEAQWNMTDARFAWTNLLCAGFSASLWKEAQVEADVISTFHTRGDMGDFYQDFSNINADNRAIRLVHFGIQQSFTDKWTVFFGLRQADADYFSTPMASLFTGGITGCYPVVRCNFDMNAYPFTALGLHFNYHPISSFIVQTSIYNGSAYDTFLRSFRFRPHADGILSLGSICYTRQATNQEPFDATYLIGWNIGNHKDNDTSRRHTQAGVWTTIEQPLPLTIGHINSALGATYAHEFCSPLSCKSYFNVMAVFGNITRSGGTLSAIFNRSYYQDAHESEVEVNFMMPIGKYFTIQPAIHHYSTNGKRQWVGQFRVTLEL